MLKTGKEVSEGQAFHRRLLSEYNTEFTLDNYVSYFTLKPIAKKIEKLRKEIEERSKELLNKPQKAPLPPLFSPNSIASTAVFRDPMSPVIPPNEPLLLKDEKLAALWDERHVAQRDFFAEIGKSYHKVQDYLIKLEKEMVAFMDQLHKQTDKDIRKMNPDYIPFLYLKLESIHKYRVLNLVAFRKILKKFLERCATDSLELQKRVFQMDSVITKSNISIPSLNFRGVAMELIAIYGTVYRYSYEEALTRLRQYEYRSGINAQRILPNSNTFFFGNTFPPHERPGNFAIRVLAGSCSLFCEKMITEMWQCARYPGTCCSQFANGETSVSLHAPLRGDDVFIVQSMVASEKHNISNSGAFMELALMIHSAQLAAASRITAVIPYLAYTRNTASISAISEIIQTMGCHHVITVDMHSDQVEGMFTIPMECISAKYEFVRFLTNQLKNEGNDFTNITIVATNGEFLGKAKDFADAMMRYGELDSEKQFVSVCTAVKRVKPQREKVHSAVARPGLVESPVTAFGATLVTPTTSESSWPIPVKQAWRANPTFTASPSPEATGTSSHEISSPVSPGDPQMNDFATVASVISEAGCSATGETNSNVNASGSGAFKRGLPALPRTGSTLGIEQALRLQEEGRRAVVTHQIEVRNEYENFALVGDVSGRLCVILDTVIDEAVNICQVARSLHANGAERIILASTHAVFAGKAIERLRESPIDLIVVTDSVNQDDVMTDPVLARKMRVVPIAPLLARAIEKIHTENTLSTLFEKS